MKFYCCWILSKDFFLWSLLFSNGPDKDLREQQVAVRFKKLQAFTETNIFGTDVKLLQCRTPTVLCKECDSLVEVRELSEELGNCI